jgi:hypothetical protein
MTGGIATRRRPGVAEEVREPGVSIRLILVLFHSA